MVDESQHLGDIASMRPAVLFVLVSLLGCTADDGASGADAGGEGGSFLTITAPGNDSILALERLDEVGRLVADAHFTADASSDVVRVEYTIAGTQPLGEATGEDFVLDHIFKASGNHLIEAYAFDASGERVADSVIRVRVGNPTITSCYQWLDLYGIEYSEGPAAEGVPEPVTVSMPINGMNYRYVENSTQRTEIFGTCELIVAMAQMAPWLREHDVVEVADIGVYNYRCIGGGTPPDCPNGISEHAFARALDIAVLTQSDGTEYSVLNDWINDSGDTCGTPAETPKNVFLHDFACAIKDERIFNIVLTPNFNDAHDNHFHIDLTPGGDFIRRTHGTRIDEGAPAHLHPSHVSL